MRRQTGSSLPQVMACLMRQAITWTKTGLLSIGLLQVKYDTNQSMAMLETNVGGLFY